MAVLARIPLGQMTCGFCTCYAVVRGFAREEIVGENAKATEAEVIRQPPRGARH